MTLKPKEMTAEERRVRERRETIEMVWWVLKSPLRMMSRPDREEAMKLASEHELTVVELMEHLYQQRRKA